MAGVKKLTVEQKEEVVALYAQGYKTRDIAQTFGIDQADVSHLANNAGFRRNPEFTRERRKKGSQKKDWRKCAHCGHQNPSVARFCMHCGGDVRDEAQVLIEQVEALRAMTALLPDSVQGEADEITRMVLKYLRGR